MRSLTSGKVLDNTFNAGVKIDTITVERRKYQFLYKDELGFHFMHTDTFEQISLEEGLIENADLIKPEEILEILFHADEEKPLTCDLPTTVEMEVTYTEPGIKGDTATNSLKPATVETGAEIRVPLFINIGDRIKIDPKTRSYVERVKN